ncbi:hypothetical protein ILUMI_02196 [Ignelater luminosus]|uniref:Retroviral polymerase SH3-like domain-containing protein n=1 Tax=Ignelater luminosus TaxID=2038154 RepID=A0A8K0DIR3_IGNLU|nr:hypothetical protein ILUMI_02196 [Ignelater luminosus]
MGHIKTFGCIAFAHINAEKRRKLEGKAINLKLVTCGGEHKAYRSLHKNTCTVTISRDVEFIEEKSKKSSTTDDEDSKKMTDDRIGQLKDIEQDSLQEKFRQDYDEVFVAVVLAVAGIRNLKVKHLDVNEGAHAFSILGRKVNSSTNEEWVEVEEFLRYLKEPTNLKLKLGNREQVGKLDGYSDADWAGDQKNQKSTPSQPMDLKLKEMVTEFKAIKNKPRNISIINAYAPTETTKGETKQRFYERLEEASDLMPQEDMKR